MLRVDVIADTGGAGRRARPTGAAAAACRAARTAGRVYGGSLTAGPTGTGVLGPRRHTDRGSMSGPQHNLVLQINNSIGAQARQSAAEVSIMSASLRVVVADDQALVRTGFRMILTAGGIDVVAEATTAPRRRTRSAAPGPTWC